MRFKIEIGKVRNIRELEEVLEQVPLPEYCMTQTEEFYRIIIQAIKDKIVEL